MRLRIKLRKVDDSGNFVVQRVILIAGFVMIAMVVSVWLGIAASNKTADAAVCVEGAENSYTGLYGDSYQDCLDSEGAHMEDHSFKSESEYSNRYN